MAGLRRRTLLPALALLGWEPARAELGSAALARLVRGYPDHLAGIEGDLLVWRDGTRMPIGTTLPPRPFEEALGSATIADQLRQPYAPGPLQTPPLPGQNPGRLRNDAFFRKMYGDCRSGDVTRLSRPVIWMPRTRPQTVPVTTVNDVAGRLERVIATLEALPERFKPFLAPSAGTYNCRAVADTSLRSMHGYGAAIDISTRQADYWLWAGGDAAPYRNRIPAEIVDAFEAERFIWGGKWHRYDTMHFEYRPELFA
jgi:hypothetical protein